MSQRLFEVIPIFVLLSFLGAEYPATAQCTLQRTFSNPAPNSNDHFGTAVSISPSYILVGSPDDDVNQQGRAFLYSASTGTLLRTFLNPTAPSGQYFGFSVAVSDSIALVGAPGNSPGNTGAGAVYAFSTATGALVHTINNPAPEFLDFFGWSVSLNATYYLIGAPYKDPPQTDEGLAYLYEGTILRETYGNPNLLGDGDLFGSSVSIDGANVLIGAPDYTGGGPFASGRAYLFLARPAALLRTFSNPAPGSSDRFGFSVSLSGDGVLVGTPGDNSGQVYGGSMQFFSASSGGLIHDIPNPTSSLTDYFGQSVSVSGNYLYAGVPGENRVRMFDALTGFLAWTIDNPTMSSDDDFGESVAGLGLQVLVGSPRNNTGAGDAGRAYLFGCPTPPVNTGADWHIYE